MHMYEDNIRGLPFITSTRRWSGSGGRGREGQRHVDVHTKSIAHWSHPVFSCKEVGVFFIKISSLDGIKSGNYLSI